MDQDIKKEFENITKEIGNLTTIVQQGLKKHDDDIEGLAIMTQQGFDEVKTEFEKTNIRIDRLYTNVDAVFHLHRKLDTELIITQHNCQDLDKRVTALETTKV